MFKGIKLRVKISGGFVVVLFLLIILAWISYTGLSSVEKKVETANHFSELVNYISNARQSEKNFIMTGDEAYSKNVKAELELLKKEALKVSGMQHSDEIDMQVNQIVLTSDEYSSAFDIYVNLAHNRNELMEGMNAKATAALTTTSGIRDSQKKAYDDLKNKSESVIAEMRYRVLIASTVQSNFLISNGLRLALGQIEDPLHHSFFTQWQGAHTDIRVNLDKVIPLLKDDTSKKMAGNILSIQKAAIAAEKIYMNDRSSSNATKTNKAINGFEKAIIYFLQQMQEDLEFYLEDVQIFSSEMITLSSGADQIAGILLNSRILEKEFIRTENQDFYTQINNNILKINDVITSIKENIEDEEKSKPLDIIQESVQNYTVSFNSYADLMAQQKIAKEQMVKSARAIQENCTRAGDAQQKKMGSQIFQSKQVMLYGSLLSIAIGIVFATLLTLTIIRPIRRVVSALKDISQGEGDLTQRIDVDTRDEIGELAEWFNIFVEKIRHIIQDISGSSDSLEVSSKELATISGSMAHSTDSMSTMSGHVTSESNEVSENMGSIASAMSETSNNVNMMASAIEEMTITISEISSNSERGRSISEKAVEHSKSASDRIKKLGHAAQDIDHVIEAINEISEQTNLLALNATIEAARAGDAGKGFAVVAGEIKVLAKQTTEATVQIKNQIDEIQGSTQGTIKEMEQIAIVINDVNAIVSTIASSIEEQSATAKELSGNVSFISTGVEKVTENTDMTSSNTDKISEEIGNMDNAAKNLSANSSDVSSKAVGLSALSEKLNEQVNTFKF